MEQIARNLTGAIDGFLRQASHLIHDRDPVGCQDSADTALACLLAREVSGTYRKSHESTPSSTGSGSKRRSPASGREAAESS